MTRVAFLALAVLALGAALVRRVRLRRVEIREITMEEYEDIQNDHYVTSLSYGLMHPSVRD